MIVGDRYGTAAIPPDSHSPEFVNAKQGSVQTDARLAKEDGAPVISPDEQSDQDGPRQPPSQ